MEGRKGGRGRERKKGRGRERRNVNRDVVNIPVGKRIASLVPFCTSCSF